MSKDHVSLDKFFTQLSELFDSGTKADHGSIFLTQKRLTYGSDTPSPQSDGTNQKDSLADLHPTAPLPVLMRATNGKSGDHRNDKIKFSTVVKPEALEGFYARYAEVCKSGMQGLKKRDRSGRKKAKAKKRKGGGVVDGDKKT